MLLVKLEYKQKKKGGSYVVIKGKTGGKRTIGRYRYKRRKKRQKEGLPLVIKGEVDEVQSWHLPLLLHPLPLLLLLSAI